jgi:hypothetical protein
MKLHSFLPLFVLVGCSSSQNDPQTTDCFLDPAGAPTELRCAGLYSNWNTRTISSDAREFYPGLVLWSDGAVKTRWIKLPSNTTIDTTDMNGWVFPVGTKFFKQFIVNGTLIETRMLWKQSTGWYRTVYRWSDDLSSTTELTTGQLNVNNTGYEVPSQTECNTCHNGQKDGILGFTGVALSAANASGITINDLITEHLITNPPINPIIIPGSALDVFALGYLHANCSHCHNPNGYAGFTGFNMKLDVEGLSSVQTTNTWNTGVNIPTVLFVEPFILGRIVPGNANASCVFYRDSRRDGVNETPSGTQMPLIDSHKVDDVGVQMISDWINGLKQ